jgi:hypothetical protein
MRFAPHGLDTRRQRRASGAERPAIQQLLASMAHGRPNRPRRRLRLKSSRRVWTLAAGPQNPKTSAIAVCRDASGRPDRTATWPPRDQQKAPWTPVTTPEPSRPRGYFGRDLIGDFDALIGGVVGEKEPDQTPKAHGSIRGPRMAAVSRHIGSPQSEGRRGRTCCSAIAISRRAKAAPRQ